MRYPSFFNLHLIGGIGRSHNLQLRIGIYSAPRHGQGRELVEKWKVVVAHHSKMWVRASNPRFKVVQLQMPDLIYYLTFESTVC
jgi:hypothetical protein